MTREEQLIFCKKCTNRKLNIQQEILCNLTGKEAAFINECNDYNMDTTIEEKPENITPLSSKSLLTKIPNKTLEKLHLEQNLPMSLTASIVVGIIGALLWAIIAVTTDYQIGYIAIAIGAAVGFTMRYFGKGIDLIYGISGCIIAILSCFLGNFFSIIGYIANNETRGYIETIYLFDYSQLVPLMKNAFRFIDILFYSFAAYEGYKFSFRSFTKKEIEQLSDI